MSEVVAMLCPNCRVPFVSFMPEPGERISCPTCEVTMETQSGPAHPMAQATKVERLG